MNNIKRIYLLSLLVFIGVNHCLADSKRTIHVAEAGTLSRYLSDSDYEQLEELTLTGEINGEDFATLRYLGGQSYVVGKDYEGWGYINHSITTLNLSGVRIVAGGRYLRIDDVTTENIYLLSDNTLPKYVFSYCKFSSITLPSSITNIEDRAFQHCSNLNTVISEVRNPYEISSSAFYDISSEAVLMVPKGTKSLYISTAGWSDNFNNIVEGEDANAEYFSINNINYKTISNNTVEVSSVDKSLNRVVIPSFVSYNGTSYSVTAIGDMAFEGRYDLTYLSIPGSIKSIGQYAFRNCGSDISVNIQDIAAWCEVDLYHEHSSPLSSAGKLLVDDEEVTSLVIPNGVTRIRKFLFYQCNSITSLNLPASLRSIGSSAFEDCKGLSSVSLSNGLTTIGGSSFEGCAALTSITLPASVTAIGMNAFAGCSNLLTINSKIQSPFDITDDVFSTYTNSVLSVPVGTKSAYLSKAGWRNFQNIVESSGTVNTSPKRTINVPVAGTLSIFISDDEADKYSVEELTLTGELNGTDLRLIRQMAGREPDMTRTGGKLRKLDLSGVRIVKGGLRYVDYMGTVQFTVEKNDVLPEYVFTKCFFQEVTLPNSITAIEDEAFEDCLNLTTVVIPEKVVSIGEEAFNGCKNLQSLTIPDQVVSIGARAFQDCSSLQFASFPESISVLGENVMKGVSLGALIWRPSSGTLLSSLIRQAGLSANPNFLLYVKNASYAPSAVKNVIVNGKAETITLSPNGDKFYCPESFTASNISYTYNYSMETGGAGKGWETIALPFDVQAITHSSKGELVPFASYKSNSDKKPFWLYGYNGSSFAKATSILAYKPYIISMPNQSKYDAKYILTGEVTFAAKNVTIQKTPQSTGLFVPAFGPIEASESVSVLNTVNAYSSQQGVFEAGSHFVPNLRNVRPFEAYFAQQSTRSVF